MKVEKRPLSELQENSGPTFPPSAPPFSCPHPFTRRELNPFEPPEESAQGAGKQNQTLGWFLLTRPKSHVSHREFEVVEVTPDSHNSSQLTRAAVQKWKGSKDITFISNIKQGVCMTG